MKSICYFLGVKIIFTVITLLFFNIETTGQCLGSEKEFKNYFQNNISKLDPLEGIWSVSGVTKIYVNYNDLGRNNNDQQTAKCAIIKVGETFITCNLSDYDDSPSMNYFKTAINGIYLFQRTFDGSNAVAKADAILSAQGLLEYTYEIPQEDMKYQMGNKYTKGLRVSKEIRMIKLFPSHDDLVKAAPSSGTGFALSSDGFIVTNHHVIEGSKKISVKGINGDFTKSYNAKVVIEDKNNDLAIIKIDDINFYSLGVIPYIIQNKTSDVGSSIFCLGYPLRASMGDEVKLTNGIISSKTGFQGDITSYQITAPVQPGNSGGPLFDDKGNLIGIISSKLMGAENASYAIKVSYLSNLIESSPTTPKLQTTSILSGKSLSEQVTLIKNLIYIIDIN